MAKILISDTHIGSPDATLANFEELKRVVREAGEPEEIFLLGDIMDLWVKPLPEALRVASPFFRAIMELGPERIVYVPGNHDHHLKSMGEEDLVLSGSKFDPYPPSFLRDIPSLRKFLERVGSSAEVGTEAEVKVESSYPLYELNSGIYLTHGHYFDRMQVGNVGGLSFDMIKLYPEDLEDRSLMSELEILSPMGLDVRSLSIKDVALSEVEKYFDWLYESLYRNSLYQELVTAERISWNVFTAIKSPLLFIYRKLGRKPLEAIADRAIRVISEITGSEPRAVIFGHTHRPGIVSKGGKVVMNCGAWVKGKGSLIVIDDGYAELREYESVGSKLLLKRSERVFL